MQVINILNTDAVAMPVFADNRRTDFLGFLPIDSLTLSALSSVLPCFDLTLFFVQITNGSIIFKFANYSFNGFTLMPKFNCFYLLFIC